MDECIFCDLLDGQGEITFVYQDELVSAFMDIQPVNAGHILVIPNQHATYLADVSEETGARLFQVAQRLAAGLRSSGLRCEGVNFFLADGEAAGQEVFHVHLHVIPRFKDDGFGLTFADSYFTMPSRSDLEETASAIREQLG